VANRWFFYAWGTFQTITWWLPSEFSIKITKQIVDCYKINIIIIGYTLKHCFFCVEFWTIITFEKKNYDHLNELKKTFNIFAKKEGKTSWIHHLKILWSYVIYIWLKIKRLQNIYVTTLTLGFAIDNEDKDPWKQ
jgi:hypothetical protein